MNNFSRIENPGCEVSRNYPVNIKEEDKTLFAHEIYKVIDPSHLAVAKQMGIMNLTIVNLHKFSFVTEYSTWKRKKYSLSLSGFKVMAKDFVEFCKLILSAPLSLNSNFDLSKGFWIFDDCSQNYFHWFTDSMTRMYMGDEFIPKYPILIPEKFAKIRFIVDSLSCLGLQTVVIKNDRFYRIKELILPSYTAMTGNYNPIYINEVREKLLNSCLSNSQTSKQSSLSNRSRRLWVSRKKAGRRYIQNEDSLLEILKKYNFEVVYAEDLTFYEQVNLFHQASIIAGIHGAGLTNMMWMSSNQTVIEIRESGDDKNNCYFALASIMNHRYFYLLANYIPSKGSKRRGFYLEPSELDELLHKIN